MTMRDRELTRREFIKLTSSGIAVAVVPGRTFSSPGRGDLSGQPASDLAETFIRPPSEARPWCYWYWMNGNMTRAGIQADLQGLADVGIGGVNLFDIALLPAGEVVNRSSEWYELVKFAISEAARHDIKVSVNCPGWSGTGGPWITPELSMQELTWSETTIGGPQEVSVALPQPPTKLGFYRDIAVLAFPTPSGDKPLPLPEVVDIDGRRLRHADAALKWNAVLSSRQFSQAPGTADSVPASHEGSDLPVELPAKFDLVFPEPVDVRSLFVRTSRQSRQFHATFFAWDESEKDFRSISQLNSQDAGPFASHIGSASFEQVRAKKFRIAFEDRKEGERIPVESLQFSGGFRVANWPLKVGFSTKPINASATDILPHEADAIASERVLDLTGKVGPDGKLNWSPPEGSWTVLRIGYTPTGIYLFPTPNGGAGLDCDKMSADAADVHYDSCVKTLIQNFGPELSKRTLAYYHSDSYESGWQNWTAKFQSEFQQRRGYELIKYIPALTGRVIGSLEITEKFLWDFRRTIGDLFAENNYGRLAQRCHEDGIGFSTEPYGGPFEQLQVGRRADRPMTEVWLPGAVIGKRLRPEAVFAGRTSGRKIQGAESFTSNPPAGGMWTEHPYSLKPLGDLIFCSGVNQLCIHVSTQQPLLDEHLRPGFTCGQNGIHFDRGNTWWQHGGKEWLECLTRCQTLLQQGQHVADALYFQGNDSPSAVGPFNPELPHGYDLDVCNSEVLSNALVRDGLVKLPSGMQYRYLVLPSHGRVTLASLRKIASLAQAGATILGTLPRDSPSLADAASQAEYKELTVALATRMHIDQSFQKVLAADKCPPDFSYDEGAGLVLHYTHRRLGDVDYYFVANASRTSGAVHCKFRIAGSVPELWRPDSRTIETCALYEQSAEMTSIPLAFDPAGSMFIVFRHDSAGTHVTSLSFADASGAAVIGPQASPLFLLSNDAGKLQLRSGQAGRYDLVMSNQRKRLLEIGPLPQPAIVEGPWTLQFPTGWGAPAKVRLDKLISWADFSDAGVRYFSGTAIYTTTFDSPKASSDGKIFLDLGKVEVIAEVWLNGKVLGTFWKPPFLCDITGMLRTEANELEVRVTNLWPNRLIGDEQFPDDCSRNGEWKSGVIPSIPEWLKKGTPRPESRRLTFCTWKHWHKDDALLPSGLLGPVMLRQARIATVITS